MQANGLLRPLAIFELFASQQRPLTLSEISDGIRVPVSSCFNLVRALEAQGFLYGAGKRRQLYPTRKIYEVASAVAAGEPWADRFGPRLERLRNLTQETAILGTRHRDQVIYLTVLDGPQNIRYTARVGDLKPLHSSSTGKALLIALDPDKREEMLSKLVLEAKTPKTMTSLAVLRRDLVKSAERGFAITRGENVVDVMAIAKPVTIEGSTYAIAVAGPMPRMEGKWQQHQRHLAGICRELEGKR